ncbi:hypothetical protein J3R82DRAFT_10542 [Butyriboletus roseoflavus]|nr:hypothetical protein J3R82DRAFT_10542 [Butyriboletus roseoflavus]
MAKPGEVATAATDRIPPIAELEHMAIMTWQQYVNCHKANTHTAHKISTIKHKDKDPQFQQQQPQCCPTACSSRNCPQTRVRERRRSNVMVTTHRLP